MRLLCAVRVLSGMRDNGHDPFTFLRPLCRWQAQPNRPEKVALVHRNTLQYAVNFYCDALLKNFTTQALGAHVLWAVRYLRSAEGKDWFGVKKLFHAAVLKKKMSVDDLLAEVSACVRVSEPVPCQRCLGPHHPLPRPCGPACPCMP